MTEQQTAAMRQALEALEPELEALVNLCNNSSLYCTADEVISRHLQLERLYKSRALEQQPADDYKAWYEEAMVASNEAGFSGMSAAETIRELDRMVNTRPQPADWVGLTDEEMFEFTITTLATFSEIRAIEARLREKNSGETR